MEPTAQQGRKSQGIPVGRPQWGDEAAVVVPKLESQQRVAAMIDPGSGIVACAIPSNPDKLLVYYEGNRMGACNMNTLEDRTLNAYGRMAKSYPTVAMAMLDANDFEAIGTISPNHFDIDVSSPNLKAWVAHEPQLLESPQKAWRPRMR